jgi:murein L,D-transpeptidase YafK
MKAAGTLLLFALAAWLLLSAWPRLRAIASEREGGSADRVANARKLRGDVLRERFTRAGLKYPPAEIYLRAFKEEGDLELWARAGEEPYRLVATFDVLAASGRAGPKRREGDRQVPEGFYHIDRFNPKSSYHLSLGLNYPNASDRVRSDQKKPGSDIFIHGKDVTIGCLPMGDEVIEEIYLAALDTAAAGQRRIPVHVFPARMSGENWERFRSEEASRDPALLSFWSELQPVFDAFERDRRLPEISVGAAGAYVVGRSAL